MTCSCRLLTLVLGVILFADCSPEAKNEASRAPARLHDGWNTASPAQFAADLALLDSMVQRLHDGDYVDIHSVVIAKDGILVFEEYFDGNNRNTLHEIRSATKSIGSILTGIAIDKGFLRSENEPVYQYFVDDYSPAGGWTDQARQVEIRHLLSMMSGHDCDDLATHFACENAMHDSDDWVQYSLDLPFAYPLGQHWAYNSASLILVGEAVARTSGLKLEEFADQYLFEPLAIDEFRWQFSPKGRAWIGGGARMVAREMAKIGQLMLNRGVWEGERILSEDWIDKSTSRQGDMLRGVDYGYLWQRGASYIGADLVEAFWASGNGGQYIIVVPDESMVVVFTGGNYDSPRAGQPFRLLTRYVLPAFMHPPALDVVSLSPPEMQALAGTYHLDFEPSATSTINVDGQGVSLLSPDGESIRLVGHSTAFFTGDSQYGPVTVVFESNDRGEIVRHTIYGSFQRFVFERE